LEEEEMQNLKSEWDILKKNIKDKKNPNVSMTIEEESERKKHVYILSCYFFYFFS
jgi:hypothetical protein